MTVGDVIKSLAAYDLEKNVYVPDSRDGTIQIVQQVGEMTHVNLPEGIAIPSDVYIIPWTDEQVQYVYQLNKA